MTQPKTRALLRALLVAALAIPVALSAPPSSAQEKPRKDEDEEREHAPTPDRLSSALDARIAGKKSASDFRIQVEWPRKDVLASCWIFGDGVGIWNRQIQFAVTKAQVQAILKAVRASGFGSLPEEFGEAEGGEADLKGKITVSIGSTAKTILQRMEGTQSPALQKLADAVFGIGEGPSQHGVTASSLQDALAKIEAGTLSPHAFEILAQRKVDHPGAESGQGWILRISGSRVTASDPQPDAPGTQRELTLSKTQFRDLLAELRKSDPASLPKNLWAPQYSMLRIQALNQLAAVSARPFAGMTAETHGEKQKVFDQTWARMAELYAQVRKNGAPVSAVPPPSPRGEKDEERD